MEAMFVRQVNALRAENHRLRRDLELCNEVSADTEFREEGWKQRSLRLEEENTHLRGALEQLVDACQAIGTKSVLHPGLPDAMVRLNLYRLEARAALEDKQRHERCCHEADASGALWEKFLGCCHEHRTITVETQSTPQAAQENQE
jgi:hypothetical protein